MEILTIGAGDVGSNLARDLAESHDLTIIDRDSDRIDALTREIDVTGTVGDGRSLAMLREAGLDQADIVIASTDNDATNVMVCNAVKQIQDAHTIARIKDVGLFHVWQSSDGGFSVDTMLCVNLLAARTLVETLALPGAQAVSLFADGQAEVAEFQIGEETPVTGQRIEEADRYPSLTFAALVRDENIIIPSGETVIQAGDSVVVIGSPSGVSRFATDVADRPALAPDDEIVVVGGDTLGYQISRLFEERGLPTQILERDADRAAWLANNLHGSTVVEADPTNVAEFERQHLPTADAVVSTLDDDTNYLLAQLARERGTAQIATIVDDPAVVELFEESDLDVIIHPQDIIAGEILQEVYQESATNVTVLEHDDAEVFETVVDEDSILAGSSLAGIAHKLPSGFVVGAIIRGDTLRTPRGGTIVQTGDRVIGFVDAEVATEVAGKI